MTRSSSRARTSERGFVLLAAIVLAVLYFALMELLLLDSARELREAQRFRARIVAAALAENAAELSVKNLFSGVPQPVSEEDEMGTMTARFRYRTAEVVDPGAVRKFEIDAEGVTKGAIAQRASVEVHGEVQGAQIRIEFTYHSQ